MKFIRADRVIFLGVLLGHALMIVLAISNHSDTQSHDDVMQAELISPPSTSQAVSPAPTPHASVQKAVPAATPQKAISKPTTLAPDAGAASSDKASTPPVPNNSSSSAQVNPSISAPPDLDETQMVIIYKPDPEAFYPSFSKRIGEEGNVELRMQVDEMGIVQSVQVALSSGSPRLDKAATELGQRIRFKPHFLNGVAIKVNAKIGIKFHLRN